MHTEGSCRKYCNNIAGIILPFIILFIHRWTIHRICTSLQH